MKKLLIISLLAIVAIAVNAQKRNLSLLTNSTGDTVLSETVTWEPTYGYTYTGASDYSGIVGFQITKTDVADSASAIAMLGSYDGVNYDTLTGNAALVSTSTDGTTLLYDTPPKYLIYKLLVTCATGDQVIFTSVRYIHKEE